MAGPVGPRTAWMLRGLRSRSSPRHTARDHIVVKGSALAILRILTKTSTQKHGDDGKPQDGPCDGPVGHPRPAWAGFSTAG